jgi:hypothetical protein
MYLSFQQNLIYKINTFSTSFIESETQNLYFSCCIKTIVSFSADKKIKQTQKKIHEIDMIWKYKQKNK